MFSGLSNSVSNFFRPRLTKNNDTLEQVDEYLDGEECPQLQQTFSSRWGLRRSSRKYSLEVGKLWISATDDGEFNIKYKTNRRDSFWNYRSEDFSAQEFAEENGFDYSGYRNCIESQNLSLEELQTRIDGVVNYDSIISDDLYGEVE